MTNTIILRRITYAMLTTTALIHAPAAIAQADTGGLSAQIEISARAVAAETTGQVDDDIIDGSSATFRIEPTLSVDSGPVLLTFSNATSRIEYFADDRNDRWQNTARLSAEIGADAATSLTIFGQRSDNIITAEAPLVDEWEAGLRLQHELNDTHRLAFGARWQDRRYAGVVPSSGQGPRIDGEYRYRFAANHYGYLRGRYESISAADPLRDLTRWTASATYQRPLARDLLLRPAINWSRLDFTGRALPLGGFRRDTVLSPEVELIYSPGAWRMAAQARYVARQSSDPAFDRAGYRFALEVGYVF